MPCTSAQRDERIVVDIEELGAQAYRAGKAGGEEQVYDVLPGERPMFHRADRSLRPVELLEAQPHLACIPSHPSSSLWQFIATHAELIAGAGRGIVAADVCGYRPAGRWHPRDTRLFRGLYGS